LHTSNGTVACSLNNENKFSFTKGARIITDLDGKPIEITGIETEPKTIEFKTGEDSYSLVIEPNCVYRLNNEGEFIKYKTVEFSI
jgi:hypothetical protein